MLDAASITRLHEALNTTWHDPEPPPPPSESEPSEPSPALITAQHRENFDLWHEEDKARDPHATDAEIVRVKHAIDRHNQCRNDLIEKLDEWLLSNLPAQNPTAPLHSESPGLIIDRLSILSLKVFHTRIEAHRESASADHRLRNTARLAILEEQCHDLAGCLDALLAEVEAGRRRFKLYRQMKMYNDPTLNPSVYQHAP
jgi:Protein of unknown function (DUF4254)